MSTHNLCFGAKIRKISTFSDEKIFLELLKSLYITQACFRNVKS